MDCMEGMKEFPDNYFDLAIVDPPYGDAGSGGVQPLWRMVPALHGTASASASTVTNSRIRGGGLQDPRGGVSRQVAGCSRTGGTWAAKFGKKIIAWDVAPGEDYFKELFRVSRNQIIWGANYFALPPTRCFLVWRKLTISESFSMAMCELAWTSFFENAKFYECAPQGNVNEKRFHPTQKPVRLYEWILKNFAHEGDRILDTHVGSASSLIACHRGGYSYWGFEIDPEYYRMASERLEREKAQVSIFDMGQGAPL